MGARAGGPFSCGPGRTERGGFLSGRPIPCLGLWTGVCQFRAGGPSLYPGAGGRRGRGKLVFVPGSGGFGSQRLRLFPGGRRRGLWEWLPVGERIVLGIHPGLRKLRRGPVYGPVCGTDHEGPGAGRGLEGGRAGGGDGKAPQFYGAAGGPGRLQECR